MVKNICYNKDGVVTWIAQDELNDIIATANVWTLDAHANELLTQHTAYCEQLILSLGYIDRVDMNTTAIADNEYKEEATLLAQYWTDSYAELMAYLGEEPTAETQKTLLQIISPFNND